MTRFLYVLPIALAVTACVSAPKFPAEEQGLPPCGSFPNCVSSDSGEGGQAIEPLQATGPQWIELKRWIDEQEDWSIVEERDNALQFVAVTPLMRFRDDVQLMFDPQLELINVRSSSRLGISDMGVNRRRVEELRQKLRDFY